MKPKVDTQEKRWLSVTETAVYLGIHLQTAYDYFYRGLIPGARIGKTLRIDKKRLDEYLEKQTEKSERRAASGLRGPRPEPGLAVQSRALV